MSSRDLDFKQVVVVRTDIKMGKGKLAVQVAHASLMAALEASRRVPGWFRAWIRGGQKKVVVKVNSAESLEEAYNRARDMGLPAALVRDAGLTQLPPGTLTAVAIGPAPSYLVDRVTGSLKLL